MTFDPHGDIPTLAVLCPPVVDYPYFQGCEADFEPDAREYSPANAWWLAEASFLAYGDVDLLTARFAGDTLLRRSGLQFELIGDNGDTGGFLMHNERVAIATFRGTRVLGLQDPLAFQRSLSPSLRDIATDVQFGQVPRGAVSDHAPIYYASFLKEQLTGRGG